MVSLSESQVYIINFSEDVKVNLTKIVREIKFGSSGFVVCREGILRNK